jgi:hypothetical protein
LSSRKQGVEKVIGRADVKIVESGRPLRAISRQQVKIVSISPQLLNITNVTLLNCELLSFDLFNFIILLPDWGE